MLTKDRWDWALGADEAETQGVDAPTLEIENDDRETWLFRISPDNGSEVRYVVTERLAGTQKTTHGTTTVVGGDILVDVDDPSRSTVGEIVVNVEMLDSDSTLRDKRLRHDFLESTHWPFAHFVTTGVAGLPSELMPGEMVDVAISGELTVKETTRAVTFEGKLSVTEDTVTAAVAATVLGSEFGVGPINIARLAHTDDQIRLEFNLVANRVDDGAVAENDLSRQVPANEVVGGAFAENVQPILEHRCVSCHTTDGPGWSTLALDTAGDAAVIADDIALVTGAGYMPPWLPSDVGVEFHNDWSLSIDELDTLATWATDGGGLDVSPDTPLVARSQLITPLVRDQVLVPDPYTGSLDQPDDYRCLVYEVDDPEGDGNWVTGFSFEPDQTAVVHHAIVYRVPASARSEVEGKDGADGQPGWTCFGRSGLRAQEVESIAGWAPGQEPDIYPAGIGIRLEAGDMIVNQIHYHYDHDTPTDASAIVLQTASKAEVADGMRSIQGTSYLTPAEIPCTPEEEGPLCDRDAVIAEIGEKYGFEATFIPSFIIAQCGGSVDDYNDLDGTVGHSSCDLSARDEGTIFSVLGHMHEFGAAYRMTLNPDTPDEQVLLDIPTWSFEWQLNYRPVDDIRIDQDDTVRFECWWDRTFVHMDEPRYITWNEGTVDEMCFSSIAVIPDPE
jgi:polyisoprenoid-binding protein YceI